MSAPKRGLGKGLGALLGDAPRTDVTRRRRAPAQIAVARITPNPYQPRKTFRCAATR